MTTTYRKTATIEATQWFKMGDHSAVVLKSDPNRYADEGIPWCPTMEGGHVVTPGDWIATGIKGEHWPIKPDVFAETYTPVDAALSTPATEPQPAPSDKIAEAARVLLDAPDEVMTGFAIDVMRANRLRDGKRIGYQPAIISALRALAGKGE